MPDSAGIVNTRSNHGVDETAEKLLKILEARGVKLFALIDHSGEAAKAGLTMRPTKLLIFGSPKVGTPVMVATPSIALDLPLKILIWEDEQAKTWITHNSTEYLRQRHGVPQDLISNFAAAEALAVAAGE